MFVQGRGCWMELEKFIVKGEVLVYSALVPQVYPYTNQTNIRLHTHTIYFLTKYIYNSLPEHFSLYRSVIVKKSRDISATILCIPLNKRLWKCKV